MTMRLCSCMVVVTMVLAGCSSGVVVSVQNETRAPLRELSVVYNGKTASVAVVPEGGRTDITLRPLGETDAVVKYRGTDGEVYECGLGVYMERGYRGRIQVTISEAGCLVGELSVSTFLPADFP